MKILVVFYSGWGHVYAMAKAVAQGVAEVNGAEAVLRRVPETLPEAARKKLGTIEIPEVAECRIDELESADAVIFGTPTRFGNMCGQMRTFLDGTGGLWAKGALVGKVGSVFTSSATQHGGQESTLLSFHTTLLHHGMVVAGLPYAFQGRTRTDGMSGGSPYGASTIAGGKCERMPSENELAAARFQGKYVAGITAKLMNYPEASFGELDPERLKGQS